MNRLLSLSFSSFLILQNAFQPSNVSAIDLPLVPNAPLPEKTNKEFKLHIMGITLFSINQTQIDYFFESTLVGRVIQDVSVYAVRAADFMLSNIVEFGGKLLQGVIDTGEEIIEGIGDIWGWISDQISTVITPDGKVMLATEDSSVIVGEVIPGNFAQFEDLTETFSGEQLPINSHLNLLSFSPLIPIDNPGEFFEPQFIFETLPTNISERDYIFYVFTGDNGNTETIITRIVSVPESTSNLSLLALSTLGAGSTLKRKLKQAKSTEEDTTKIG